MLHFFYKNEIYKMIDPKSPNYFCAKTWNGFNSIVHGVSMVAFVHGGGG